MQDEPHQITLSVSENKIFKMHYCLYPTAPPLFISVLLHRLHTVVNYQRLTTNAVLIDMEYDTYGTDGSARKAQFTTGSETLKPRLGWSGYLKSGETALLVEKKMRHVRLFNTIHVYTTYVV